MGEVDLERKMEDTELLPRSDSLPILAIASPLISVDKRAHWSNP